MVRHHPGAPRAGSPIRHLPSRGGDLLRGKRALVGGESCGFWNGPHETTMALLYTIRSAKPTSVEDTTVPQTRSLRQHLLLTWADVSKERPPLHADVAQLARESVAPHADRSPVRVRPSAPVEGREQRHCLHLHRQVKPSRWGLILPRAGASRCDRAKAPYSTCCHGSNGRAADL